MGCLYVGGHCTRKIIYRRMKMKNTIKVLGNLTRACSAKVPFVIIALVAVIGFSCAAYDNGLGGG